MGRTERLERRNQVLQVRERGSMGKRTEAGGTPRNSFGRQQAGLAGAPEDISGKDVCGMP